MRGFTLLFGGGTGFCLTRGVRGTGWGGGKKLGASSRMLEVRGKGRKGRRIATEGGLGSLHLGDLRVALLGFNISDGFSVFLYGAF